MQILYGRSNFFDIVKCQQENSEHQANIPKGSPSQEGEPLHVNHAGSGGSMADSLFNTLSSPYASHHRRQDLAKLNGNAVCLHFSSLIHINYASSSCSACKACVCPFLKVTQCAYRVTHVYCPTTAIPPPLPKQCTAGQFRGSGGVAGGLFR